LVLINAGDIRRNKPAAGLAAKAFNLIGGRARHGHDEPGGVRQ
jgi:hypothetical protein